MATRPKKFILTNTSEIPNPPAERFAGDELSTVGSNTSDPPVETVGTLLRWTRYRAKIKIYKLGQIAVVRSGRPTEWYIYPEKFSWLMEGEFEQKCFGFDNHQGMNNFVYDKLTVQDDNADVFDVQYWPPNICDYFDSPIEYDLPSTFYDKQNCLGEDGPFNFGLFLHPGCPNNDCEDGRGFDCSECQLDDIFFPDGGVLTENNISNEDIWRSYMGCCSWGSLGQRFPPRLRTELFTSCTQMDEIANRDPLARGDSLCAWLTGLSGFSGKGSAGCSSFYLDKCLSSTICGTECIGRSCSNYQFEGGGLDPGFGNLPITQEDYDARKIRPVIVDTHIGVDRDCSTNRGLSDIQWVSDPSLKCRISEPIDIPDDCDFCGTIKLLNDSQCCNELLQKITSKYLAPSKQRIKNKLEDYILGSCCPAS